MTCGGALCRHGHRLQLVTEGALCHQVQGLELGFLHAASIAELNI